jgi:hypothetical protein
MAKVAEWIQGLPSPCYWLLDAAKLAALRDAARIGMADFDAGRFSTFSDTSEMRKHLYSRAAKVIAKTKRG